MKFAYGKKQKVNDVELDKLFLDLQAVLQKHPVVPSENVDALVSEWINDILFVMGKITDEELQEEAKELGGDQEEGEPPEEDEE